MDPASYYDNNVTESLVLEAVRAAGIDCVVFSSS
jgi:UDP-glucose 4-epimerase